MFSYGLPHLCFLVAFVALAVHTVVVELQKRNARRQVVGLAGQKAQQYGLTESATLALAYSQGRYGAFFHQLGCFITKFTTDPNFLVTELKGAVAHLASTADGLKVLTDAVASAQPKTA